VPRQQNGEINGAIAVVTDLTVQNNRTGARKAVKVNALHAVATAEAESLSEEEIIHKVTLGLAGSIQRSAVYPA
jgi:nanoRNase/pAp phosphatase (c-di-AMP/oligoRNAs hydrolase)